MQVAALKNAATSYIFDVASVKNSKWCGPNKGKHKEFTALRGIWVVRYADDFIITCPDRDKLEGEINDKVTNFLSRRGLTLSLSKTKIIDLERDSFKFLGWSISKRQRDLKFNKKGNNPRVLVIKPSPEKIKNIKRIIKEEFDADRPIESIVRTLNPKLRGWTNYYRTSYHSQDTFQSLQNFVYQTWKRWAKRRHPTRPMKWIVKKYVHFNLSCKRKWVIGTPNGVTVFDPSTANEWIVRPIKAWKNWYEDTDYFAERALYLNAEKFRKAVYAKHSYKCAGCMTPLNEDVIELHHIIPKKDGGEWNLENIVPLHKSCHIGITNAKGIIYDF